MHPLQSMTKENAELVTRILDAALYAPAWAMPLNDDEEEHVREMIDRAHRHQKGSHVHQDH